MVRAVAMVTAALNRKKDSCMDSVHPIVKVCLSGRDRTREKPLGCEHKKTIFCCESFLRRLFVFLSLFVLL